MLDFCYIERDLLTSCERLVNKDVHTFIVMISEDPIRTSSCYQGLHLKYSTFI